MNKCGLDKRIVVSILLLTHVEISCFNHYNPEVGQNQLSDQTNTTLLNLASDSPNSNGQAVTIASFVGEEEDCSGFSQEVDDKKTDDQESEPFQADLTLAKENCSKIEKTDASRVILPRNMSDNNEQSSNQELVSSLSVSLNHEVKETSNFTQSRYQAITGEKQVHLQKDLSQEDATGTQLAEAVQIDQMEGQQADNQTLITQSLQASTYLQQETAADDELDEQMEQVSRNKVLELQVKQKSSIISGIMLGVLAVAFFIVGGGFYSNLIMEGGIILDCAIIFIGFSFGIPSIFILTKAWRNWRTFKRAGIHTHHPIQ